MNREIENDRKICSSPKTESLSSERKWLIDSSEIELRIDRDCLGYPSICTNCILLELKRDQRLCSTIPPEDSIKRVFDISNCVYEVYGSIFRMQDDLRFE